MSSTTRAPHLSIIIPVYNEEGILHSSVIDLLSRLDELVGTPPKWEYEILLAENGSTDRTVAIGKELASKHPQVQINSLGQPNYGLALREGILRARGRFVVCDEIDLCDIDFYTSALDLLERDQADMVVGSKVMAGAEDKRPILRHTATLVINSMLRILVGFRGTDTHGLKAFHRERLVDVARRCVVDRDLFASEFVIRTQREGNRVREIPLHIVEKRPPSINLFKRVPKALRGIAKLTYVVRWKG